MIGTLLNASAILVGGAVGLTARGHLPERTQRWIRNAMGAVTLFLGFRLIWKGLNGGFLEILAEFGLMLLAVLLGHALGRAMRLQSLTNRAGEFSRRAMAQASDRTAGQRFSEGLSTCTLLFCVGPLALLGSIQDGLHGDYWILAVKAVMDGMSSVFFGKLFGWGALLSALPVLAYQGTLTLAAHGLGAWMQPEMLDAVSAAGGFLLLAVGLVILEISRVELSNYLPSLAVAPMLAWLFAR